MENFTALTKIAVSKSSLGQLVQAYGGLVVAQQAAEAEAMVKPPDKEEVIQPRLMPQPDSEVMALSMDGVMVNIVGEGWKEVKVVTVSAVEVEVEGEAGDKEVSLSQHSYRAGLWEAKEFAKQQGAEGCRPGLERAKTVVSINDGAAWIWLIVAMCWTPCVEILDWWHVVQKLWLVAHKLLGEDQPLNVAWVERQKSALWNGRLRAVLAAIRPLCPRDQPLPDPVRQVVGYLFQHRRRLRYQEFRQAGYPIGSGCTESACKVVVQARLKQAGMRWSRRGAQTMLALRSVLLSERWDEVWTSLHPHPKLT